MPASGKFVLRLPPALHERLRDTARGLGVSLNALCARLLQDAAARIEAGRTTQPTWHDRVADFVRVAQVRVIGTILFGSAARGELRHGSDIDLLVVVDAATPLSRSLYARWDEVALGQTSDREVNAHFVKLPASVEEAGSLWLEAAVEGVILQDESGRVRRFLQDLRRAVAAGRFVRSVAHGQPYWKRA